MGGSNVSLKEGKHFSEFKKKDIYKYVYIQMEYLGENTFEEKEFKIEQVK